MVSPSRQDLEAIAEYISADSPQYADAVVRKVIGLTQTLTQFPHAGRKVPEFDEDSVRELLAYSYRIIYRVEAAEVVIAAVIHGRRVIAEAAAKSVAFNRA